ncbi:MAG: YbaK/EbsC family protein [bacterium]
MSVDLFKRYCQENGIDVETIQEGSSTHTARDSAENYGVGLNQIVKSLLLKVGDEFCIFLISGDKRLDFDMLKERFGKEIRMATAEEVKEVTGYSIGGVPPFGHKSKLTTYIEDGFPIDGELFAAAGNIDAVFKTDLERLTRYCSQP